MKNFLSALLATLFVCAASAQPAANQQIGQQMASAAATSVANLNLYLQCANPLYYVTNTAGTTKLTAYGVVIDNTTATDTMTILQAKGAAAGVFYAFGKSNSDTTHAIWIKLVAGDSIVGLTTFGAYQTGTVSIYTKGTFTKIISDGFNWHLYFKLPDSYFEQLFGSQPF